MSVTHTYTDAGNYDVTLTVEDSAGASHSVTQAVPVLTAGGNSPPTAAFTYTPSPATEDVVITFDASTTTDPDGDAITSYLWDLNNDGITDKTGLTMTHSFPNAGTYNIKLTVTDAAGSTDIEIQTVVVQTVGGNSPPVAAFTYSPLTLVEGDTVTFDGSTSSDPNGDTLSYFWDFNGDGLTDSTEMSPIHTFASAGSYNVVLRVSDPSDSTNSKTRTIIVSAATGNSPPTASFTYTPTAPQESDPITFDGSGSSDPDRGDDLTYSWDLNNDGIGDKSGVAMTHTFFSSGNYQVTLKVTDQAGVSQPRAVTHPPWRPLTLTQSLLMRETQLPSIAQRATTRKGRL